MRLEHRLGFVGGILPTFFGLPNAKALNALMNPTGQWRLLLEEDDAGRQLTRGIISRHQFGGRIGLALIMVGFFLQLVWNGMQADWLGYVKGHWLG
jgi:hypothetical protein